MDQVGLALYWDLVDRLREQRRLPGHKPEHDRPILDQIEDVYDTLSDADQEQAKRGTWRGWPDLFDAHGKD